MSIATQPTAESAIYIEKSDTGATLSTWIYCFMWQLWAAEQEGIGPCYIHWPQGHTTSLIPLQDPAKFAEKPNMFDWYFIQPHLSCRTLPPPPKSRSYAWENDAMGVGGESLTGKWCLQGQPKDVLKAYYRERLHFNEEVIARGKALQAKYNIDFSNLLSVTWRGTDSVTDGRPRVPIETYYPYLDEILAKEPNLQFFATAEEHGIVEELKLRYPQVFTIEEFSSSPALPKHCTVADYHAAGFAEQHNPEWTSPKSGFERGMQVALMIWILSQSKHYVKNRSSLAFVSSWLSTGNIVSILHPEVA